MFGFFLEYNLLMASEVFCFIKNIPQATIDHFHPKSHAATTKLGKDPKVPLDCGGYDLLQKQNIW